MTALENEGTPQASASATGGAGSGPSAMPLAVQTPESLPHAREDNSGSDEPEEPDPSKAGREAAAYRRKLRDAEAERDALAGRLEAAQRRDVERIAADLLGDPKDLWLGGVQVAEVLDDEGQVDRERLDARIAEVLTEHPSWKRFVVPSFDGGVRTSSPRPAPTFGDLLRGK